MVSYYNHFAMYPKNHSGNLPYTASSGWYPGNYQHQPPHPQFIGDGESSPQPMYYPHPHVFHQSSPDWSGHENFSTPPQTTLLPHGPSPGGLHLGGGHGGGPGGAGAGGNPGGNNSSSNNNGSDHLGDGLHSIPSPPITVSGSDMSSPGAPNGSSSPQISSRPTPVKSPFEWMKKQSYQSQPNPGLINICSAPSLQDFTPVESAVSPHIETLKSTAPYDQEPLNLSTSSDKEQLNSLISYDRKALQSVATDSPDKETLKSAESPDKQTLSPAEGPIEFGTRPDDEPFKLTWPIEAFPVIKIVRKKYPINYEKRGKTRTKDKYRVVYTDQQRLELEKEFHYTRYITIRRKSELAQSLQLSERQVKIWFQNRRAKDRKQKKKAENGSSVALNGQGLGSVHAQHSHPHHHVGGQSMSSLLGDTKPKLEPSLHLSHLHPMSAMSMGMGSMGLHPAHHPLHSHLGVPTSQHLSQGPGSQVPPASLSIM